MSNQLANNRTNPCPERQTLNRLQQFQQEVHKRAVYQAICDMGILDYRLKVVQGVQLFTQVCVF